MTQRSFASGLRETFATLRLGFQLDPEKSQPPSQVCAILGVYFNTGEPKDHSRRGQFFLTSSAGPVFTHLDLGLLGDWMGPDQQPRLRKRFNPDDNLLRKLLHGAMVGRGGQKNSAGECAVPAESEVVLCHISSDRSKMDCRSVFRPESSRKDASPDAEEKEVIIAFEDESMHLRKKLSRGCYSLRPTLLFYSKSPLIPDVVPEKQYDLYLHTNKLSPALAASTVGKFQFLCSTLFGRVGRCCTGPLRRRQYASYPVESLTTELQLSLRQMKAFLSTCPSPELKLKHEDPILLYTDASDVPGRIPQRILGAFSFDPLDQYCGYTAWPVPDFVVNKWLQRKSFMGQLELLAALVAFQTWQTRLQHRSVFLFLR